MTPKEKAEKLILSMYQYLPASKEAEKGKEHLYYNQYNAAKHCAKIAVNEILHFMIITCKWDKKINGNWDIKTNSNVEFWNEVLKEIDKL